MKTLALIYSSVICLLFALPGLTSAADKNDMLKMEELSVQVMPEFSFHPSDKNEEQPPLLIGYHGTLINKTETSQKGEIEIPLPMDAKNFRIGFVADYAGDRTEMNEIKYSLDKEKGTIAWETSNEIEPQELYKFVIEFYTDSIKAKDNGEKTLSYTFKSFADIGMLNLIFVEPLKTDSFKLEPAAETHQKNTYNMNMFLYQQRGMKPNEEKNVELVYKRTESATTMDIMDAMAGKSAGSNGAVRDNETMPLWIIISVITGITVVAAAFLVFILKRRTKQLSTTQPQKDALREIKKAKLRTMLLDGTVTEAEYNQLIKKLGGR